MKRPVSSCLVIFIAIFLQWPVWASVETRRTPVVIAVERAIPAVVDISTKKRIRVSTSPFGRFRTPFDDLLFPRDLFQSTYVGTSLGSGVIVDTQGHIITNNHVVTFSRGQGGVADEILVLLQGEDVQRRARIVGREPSDDIAILQLIGDPPSHYLPFGVSSDLMIGETVIAIGYALGQSHTVTQGIISQLGRFVEDENGDVLPNLIQTDADINPGNSGGPLINLDGQLVGINTAIASPSGGSVGIGFAIPVNRVRKVYNQYVLGQPSLEHRLGIRIQTLYPRLRAALRAQAQGFKTVKDLHGVLVTDVKPGSAASGSLRRLDLIQAVNGNRIESSDDITTGLVPQTDPSVQLDILREGKRRSLTIALRGRGVQLTTQWLGMDLRDLDTHWRKQWNVNRNVEGLVVTKVRKNSPASQAELKPGDIIFQIGPTGSSMSGIPIVSLSDLAAAREKLAGINVFTVLFYRYEIRGGWSRWRTEIEHKPI